MALGPLIPFVRPQWLDNNGVPVSGGKLFVYLANSSTKTDTYTTSALTVANTNPVILDSSGRATVYLDPAITYKFILSPSTDTDPPTNAIWTNDGVPGIIPFTAPATFERDGIGATSTDAAIILNVTAAANGAQQWSPRVRWSGQGWNPTASASREVDVIVEAVPVQQVSGDPLVSWVVSTQVNGGGYTPRLLIRSDGQFLVNTNKLTVDTSGNLLVNTTQLAVVAATGFIGLGTASPAALTHLYVAGTAPSISTASTQLVIQNNAATSDSTGITFISGASTGHANIRFGTSANQAVNALAYDYATGLLTFTSGYTERMRTFAMGATQTRTFAAGNFTSSTGTWVVGSGDVTTESYRVVGDTMWYTAVLLTTTITGTPTTLLITPPAGATIAENAEVRCGNCTDGSGAAIDCVARAAVASNKIQIAPYSAANFTAGADVVAVRFQISFQVTGV